MPTRKFLDLARTKLKNLPKFPEALSKMSQSPAPGFHYLDAESNLGAQIFGSIPPGVDRKFFHSTRQNVWIWHENGTTVRYEVRPDGVYKRINSDPFTKLTGPELANFRTAAHNYLTAIKTHLYKKP